MNHEEFNDAWYTNLEKALYFSKKARHEGLLSLEEELENLENEKSDLLKIGLRLVLDGTDETITSKILSNIVNREKDEYLSLLKTIKKETLLIIQQGINPRTLALILNSYTDIPLNDSRFQKVLGDFCDG